MCRALEVQKRALMRSQLFRCLAVCVVSASVATATLTVASPVSAASSTAKTDAAISAVPGLTASSGGVQTTDSQSALVTKQSEITVSAPKNAVDGVSISSGDKAAIKVGIPGAKNAKPARKSSDGVVVYADTAKSASTAVQSAIDGSTRFLTVISGPDAPTEYRFPLTLPEGGLALQSNGGIDILDGAGNPVGAIQPPWGLDAKKRVVDTRYTLDGNTVVLHVDHENATYPVVADPNVSYNCGIVTCTAYFNRSVTYQMNQQAKLGTLAAVGAFGICALALVGVGSPLCLAAGVVIGLILGVVDVAASNNACLTIRYGLTTWMAPLVGWSNGAYCQDGTPTAVPLRTHFNNKCLDADLNTMNRLGIIVQLWDCNGQPQQQWRFYRDGTVRSAYNGRCLDADLNTINRNGTTVQLWTCNGQPQQKWDGRTGAITSRYNGRCLDADLNTIYRNGAKVQLWDCNGQAQQQWWQ